MKEYIRSFRYDAVTASCLDMFEGKNINDKFEKMVRYCFFEYGKIKYKRKKAEEETQAYLLRLKNLQNDLQKLLDELM